MEQSHSQWVESLTNGDPRKWIVEEGPDGNGRYWVFDENELPKLPGGEGPAARRKRKVRETLAKKVSKEGKSFTWRLGYNHCIGQWSGSDRYPTLSGSSLNRKRKKNTGARLFEDYPELESGQATHVFSARSRGKVKDKATAFYRSISGNRIFLTLTFIEVIPDKLGVEILNKFLTVLRKEQRGLEYLRVSEPQEENHDNIHFHILLNRRLPIKRYNALWVLQQYNSGLTGHRANGEAILKEEIERRYQYDVTTTKFSKKDPDSMMAVLNPFHIEKAYKMNGLAYYLTKYITKQKGKHEFGCLAWHCSRRVSKLFTKEVVSPSTFAYLNSFVNYKVDYKTGECYIPDVICRPFFTMVYINNKGAPLKRLKQLEIVNKWLIKEQVRDPDRRELAVLDDDLYRKIICKN